MATLRRCTATPVTSRPPKCTAPEVGRNRPAISCIRVVLPASVVPSRTSRPSEASSTLVCAIWRSAPTRRVMPFRASDTLRGPRLAMRSARAPRIAQLSSALAGPALDQFVVLDGFALGLLVFELRLRATLADPLLGVLLLVQARTATAIDLGLLVGGLHARHDLVHLAGEPVHGLLRREG